MAQDEPGEQAEAGAASAQTPADAGDATADDDAVAAEPPVEETVDELRAQVDDLRAKHARAAADYQNLRRRSEEDRLEHSRLTQKALLLNYLPVLDDLNRALDAVREHAEIAEHRWVEGVRMVQRKFVGVMEAAGAREIEAEGGAFDPELHEAVSYVVGPEGQVMAVVQSGYTIGGQVIRPAMVLVGNGATDDDAAHEDETNEETAGDGAEGGAPPSAD
jgi:molecular chaperone GrpE